jgi:hypothetical protein
VHVRPGGQVGRTGGAGGKTQVHVIVGAQGRGPVVPVCVTVWPVATRVSLIKKTGINAVG